MPFPKNFWLIKLGHAIREHARDIVEQPLPEGMRKLLARFG